MDPLALLSNLHGDGPATLQRLRRNGCDTLTCLLGSPAREIAPILGWEMVRAERFLREAELLARRLGDGLLDVEEDAPEPVASEPKRALHALDEDEDEDEDAEPEGAADEDAADEDAEDEDAEDEDAEDEAPGEAELAEEIRAEVLTRWRTLDATEALPPPEDTLVPHAPPAPPAAVPSGRPLATAAIDGLDPIRIRALQSAGIATLEALAQADDLALHRATGLPYTVASRLTFLARRAVARNSPASARPKPARSDAGGPFA